MNTLYICFGWFVLKTMKPNSQYPFLVFASSNQYNTCYESIVFGVANVEGDQKPARKKTTVFEIVSQWGCLIHGGGSCLLSEKLKHHGYRNSVPAL